MPREAGYRPSTPPTMRFRQILMPATSSKVKVVIHARRAGTRPQKSVLPADTKIPRDHRSQGMTGRGSRNKCRKRSLLQGRGSHARPTGGYSPGLPHSTPGLPHSTPGLPHSTPAPRHQQKLRVSASMCLRVPRAPCPVLRPLLALRLCVTVPVRLSAPVLHHPTLICPVTAAAITALRCSHSKTTARSAALIKASMRAPSA
ncbi:MAG: hypothetical protein RLY87_2404, partial [Chloroflexota bacterium]